MKGIYYSRQDGTDREDWHQPVIGDEIFINRNEFVRYFPDIEIQGESERDYNVKVIFEENGFHVEACDEYNPSHQIGTFDWHWSGHGTREWWFDDNAICLASTNDYRSGTGLTADSTRVVAHNRKIDVDSFRGDCSDENNTTPRPEKIWAEFVNSDGGYRANWTGFAIGSIGNEDGRYTSSGGWVSGNTPIIGDRLDEIIEIVLSGQPETLTTCKHNSNIQAHIIVSDQTKLPLYLCKSCRMRGVRWEEFASRDRQDTCPYFRRACKSVVERSDQFPEWFSWSGNNLLSSHRRMSDGENEAYEVVYVRRKEGFVRRLVLLLNTRTREAWMYRYNGFIPRTMSEFRTKYAEGRQINGYMSTGPDDGYHEDPNDRFLSEAKIVDAVAQGLEQPLWQNGSSSLISFNLGRQDIEQYAIQKGEINGFQITQLDEEGEEREVETKQNPSPFYTDEGASYYLVYSGWSNSTVFRRNNEELYCSNRSGPYWYLLRIAR